MHAIPPIHIPPKNKLDISLHFRVISVRSYLMHPVHYMRAGVLKHELQRKKCGPLNLFTRCWFGRLHEPLIHPPPLPLLHTHAESHRETTFQPKAFTNKLDGPVEEADPLPGTPGLVCKHLISKRRRCRVLPHAACLRLNTCFRFKATTHRQVLNIHFAVILFWARSIFGV